MRIGDTIYLDHQATTPVEPRVLAEMAAFHCESFGNPHSSDHILGWESARAIEKSAARVARLIGSDSEEIFFTSGATESNNMALLGLGRRARGGRRRRVLVSAIEHKCVLASVRALEEQYQYSVEEIPVDRQGFVDFSALNNTLNDEVLVVSVMVVNNEIGTIQDVWKISELARRNGVVFHCDAAQGPLTMPIDMLAEHTDMLSLSGHKIYGPKGIGVIYISHELQEKVEPLIYGGGQQRELRSGTLPVPLCVGMGAAANLLVGQDAEKQRGALRRRRDAFVHRLSELPWPISLNGPEGERRHSGNVNICFSGFSAHEILGTLQPRLAASTGSACTSGIPEPSHVLRATGLEMDQAESSVRFSLGFDTSDDDVEEAVKLICETLESLSKAKLVRSA